MSRAPFRKAHKRVVELERDLAIVRTENAVLVAQNKDLLHTIVEYETAIDAALVETHAEQPTEVAEYIILLEHAVERHLTVEGERDAAIAERDELARKLARAKTNAAVSREDWEFVCGKLAFLTGKDVALEEKPSAYRKGYAEQRRRTPPAYEHMTPATIAAIASTTQTQAGRAGETQAEVFERTLSSADADREYDKVLARLAQQTSTEEPPPAKDDAQ